MAKALDTFERELAWRQRAQREVGAGLRAYEQAIRDSIGLRQQRALPRNRALDVANCSAAHRDVSLYF